MIKLTERQLLDLYASSKACSEQERAFFILHSLQPDMPISDLEQLCLGDQDRFLWAARQQLFGGGFEAKIQCPDCEEWMELGMDASFAIPPKIKDRIKLTFKGQTYQLRLPNISDLKEAKKGFPYHRLAKNAPWNNTSFRQKAAKALEAADPGMDVIFAANCSDCQASLNASFDAFRFLWADMQERAHSILSEIIDLAHAFGWSELECLRLGPARRRAYLERIS